MPKTMALNIAIGASIAGALKGAANVMGNIGDIGKTIDGLNKKKISLLENDKSIKRYTKGLANINKAINKLSQEKRDLDIGIKVARSTKQAERLKNELDRVKLGIAKLNRTKFRLKEKVNGAKHAFEETNAEAKRLQHTINALNQNKIRLDRYKEKKEGYRSRFVETVAIGATVAFPVKQAVAFESAMADVRKSAGLSKEETKAFRKELLKLTGTIPLTGEELAKLTASGAQLGIKREQLQSFTTLAAKMSTAFDIADKEAAGDAIAKIMNLYGGGIDGVRKIGDALNHLSDNTAAKARDLLNVLGRVSGTAKMFGLSAQQTSALADAFLAMGKSPEVASTAINALLLKLNTADKQGKKFQDGLAKIGLTPTQIKLGIKDNPQETIMAVLESIKELDKQSQIGILSDMFGAEYADDIALLVGGLDNYKKALKLVAKESNYAGSMEKEYQNRLDTTENKLRLLKNSLTRVAINLGSVVLPALGELADMLKRGSEWVSAMNEKYPLLGSVISYTAVAIGSFTVTGYAMGYMFSIVGAGITKMINITTTLRGILIGGIGLKRTGIAAYFLSGGLQASGSSAGVAKGGLIGLKGTVLSLYGAVLALGAAFVWLNSQIAASGKADIDSKHLMGKSVSKLKSQEQYLKERIASMKKGGMFETIAHGSPNAHKIEEYEKRLKATQRRIKKLQTAEPKVKTDAVTPEKIEKSVGDGIKEATSHTYKDFLKKSTPVPGAPVQDKSTSAYNRNSGRHSGSYAGGSQNSATAGGSKSYTININVVVDQAKDITHNIAMILPDLIRDIESGKLARSMYDM